MSNEIDIAQYTPPHAAQLIIMPIFSSDSAGSSADLCTWDAEPINLNFGAIGSNFMMTVMDQAEEALVCDLDTIYDCFPIKYV